MFRFLRFFVTILFFLFFSFAAEDNFFGAAAKILVQGDENEKNSPFDIYAVNVWQDVEKGMQFLRVTETIMRDREDGKNQKLPVTVYFDVLKFNSRYFSFDVFSACIDGTSSKSLPQWAKEFDLKAVINASMYLPDKTTSIGYLKKGSQYNNKRRGKNLGAYFVSMPYPEYGENIPQAAIFYADDPDLSRFFSENEKERTVSDVLKKYKVAVQNFRIFDLEKNKSDWTAQRRHAICAVAEDKNGEILLMYASNPMTIREFSTILQKNPLLNLKRAMYAEGGSEAGMFYAGKQKLLWQHDDNIIFFLKGTVDLPNVIGVKKR